MAIPDEDLFIGGEKGLSVLWSIVIVPLLDEIDIKTPTYDAFYDILVSHVKNLTAKLKEYVQVSSICF
jgi:hypothetical protein